MILIAVYSTKSLNIYPSLSRSLLTFKDYGEKKTIQFTRSHDNNYYYNTLLLYSHKCMREDNVAAAAATMHVSQ